MEANANTKENFKESVEAIEESLQEVINVVQLFGDAVESGDEALYIQRSIHTIEKMLKAICDTDIQRLKATVIKQ